MPNQPASGKIPGLPGCVLAEIHDSLALAMDATERRSGYSQAEREARSYMRFALRRTIFLLEGGAL